MSETSTIVRPTLEDIRSLGIPAERVHAGQVKVRGGWMHLGSPGTPDLWTALGWLEGKLPGDKNTKPERRVAQAKWRAEAQRWGVRVEQFESREQALAIVQRWLAEREYARAMGWDQGP